MPPGSQTLTPDQVDRLLELPKLDQRSRAALLDFRDHKVTLPGLRAALLEDPAVARYVREGGRFLKAAARVPFFVVFPEAIPAQAAPKAAPAKLQPPPVAVVPMAAADPGLDRLETVLNQLTSRPDDEEASLVLKLHRIERAGGFDRKTFTGVSVQLRGEEIPRDLGLEERTQEHAETCGRFGAYQWAITAKLGAEVILDTTRTVTVEAPAGYQPPHAAPAAPGTPAADPRTEARENLALFKEMAGVLGALGGAGKGSLTLGDLEAARAAAYTNGHAAGELRGRLEARETLAREHREDLERAEGRAYDRGKVDGKREAEDAFRDERRELEDAAAGEGPGTLEKVVGMVGGPQVLGSLVSALAQGLLSKPQAPAAPMAAQAPAPVRPPVPLVPQPIAVQAPVQAPIPAPPPAVSPEPAAGPEPSRAEYVEAIGTVQHLLNLLDEAAELRPDQAAQLEPARKVADRALAEGLKDGSLTAWWATWRGGLGQQLEGLIHALEQELGRLEAPASEEPVDVETLKRTLAQRLEESASPEAIVAELQETVPPGTLNNWRRMLATVPEGMALAFLGIPEHQAEAGRAVLASFKATS